MDRERERERERRRERECEGDGERGRNIEQRIQIRNRLGLVPRSKGQVRETEGGRERARYREI